MITYHYVNYDSIIAIPWFPTRICLLYDMTRLRAAKAHAPNVTRHQ